MHTTIDDHTLTSSRGSWALTESQVAEQLGLSVATLRAWRHRGRGPRFCTDSAAPSGTCRQTSPSSCARAQLTQRLFPRRSEAEDLGELQA